MSKARRLAMQCRQQAIRLEALADRRKARGGRVRALELRIRAYEARGWARVWLERAHSEDQHATADDAADNDCDEHSTIQDLVT